MNTKVRQMTGAVNCPKCFLSLAVLDGVTRYTQNRVLAPRRFHTALRVARVLELAARPKTFLPERSATLKTGRLANHTHHKLIDRTHLVPTPMCNHVPG